MPKVKKIKKIPKVEKTVEKEDSKVLGNEEETEKEGGALSDGVLDAFDELTPADILILEEETELALEDDDDEIDSGDYKPNDEW